MTNNSFSSLQFGELLESLGNRHLNYQSLEPLLPTRSNNGNKVQVDIATRFQLRAVKLICSYSRAQFLHM